MGDAEVASFPELYWRIPVQMKSVLQVAVTSRSQDIGSAEVDLDGMRSIPLDAKGRREVCMYACNLCMTTMMISRLHVVC